MATEPGCARVGYRPCSGWERPAALPAGVLGGRLAVDHAVSVAAARIKGIDSPAAGHAGVLVVPDLESGNMLAEQLEYPGDAASAGIVLAQRCRVSRP